MVRKFKKFGTNFALENQPLASVTEGDKVPSSERDFTDKKSK